MEDVAKQIVSVNLSRIVKQKVSDIAPVLEDGEDETIKSFKPTLFTSLVSGATAGIIVDFSLFPLDTMKTRLQSQQGFRAAGGFKGVYNGIMPVLIGSAPISATFFGCYNTIINYLKKETKQMPDVWIHFTAACVSEIVSSAFRVPLELLKQKKQTSLVPRIRSLDILKETWKVEGFSGLYRGFWSTIFREIPFTALQFPLWEFFKECVSRKKNRPVTTFETAYCGAAAGGISGALTTPVDVVKTRVMLASNETAIKYGRFISLYMARDIVSERGPTGLFAGIVPRVLWITLGGFIYFGMYELMKNICEEQTLVPVQKSMESKCSVNVAELKEKEAQRAMVAQYAPSYTSDGD